MCFRSWPRSLYNMHKTCLQMFHCVKKPKSFVIWVRKNMVSNQQLTLVVNSLGGLIMVSVSTKRFNGFGFCMRLWYVTHHSYNVSRGNEAIYPFFTLSIITFMAWIEMFIAFFSLLLFLFLFVHNDPMSLTLKAQPTSSSYMSINYGSSNLRRITNYQSASYP